MAGSDTHDPRAEPPREPIEDALGRLEERLERASQAAERLLADAAERVSGASGAAKPPPAGWQQARPGGESAQPPPEGEAASPLLADADLLLGLLGAVRDRIPPELQQRLAEAIREVLLALRALIDWYLERTGRARSGPAEVQDIPIL